MTRSIGKLVAVLVVVVALGCSERRAQQRAMSLFVRWGAYCWLLQRVWGRGCAVPPPRTVALDSAAEQGP